MPRDAVIDIDFDNGLTVSSRTGSTRLPWLTALCVQLFSLAVNRLVFGSHSQYAFSSALSDLDLRLISSAVLSVMNANASPMHLGSSRSVIPASGGSSFSPFWYDSYRSDAHVDVSSSVAPITWPTEKVTGGRVLWHLAPSLCDPVLCKTVCDILRCLLE